MSVRLVIGPFLIVSFAVGHKATGMYSSNDISLCCWNRWGDASTCANYPVDGTGGLCSTDWITECNGPDDCPGWPSPTPPTPTPPVPPPTTSQVIPTTSQVMPTTNTVTSTTQIRSTTVRTTMPLTSSGIATTTRTTTSMQEVTTTQAATQLIPADNDAFRFIGRSELVDIEGGKGVRFDVPGFEIRFRVTGTSTVRVLLQQKWTSEPPFLPSGCCCTGSKPHNFLVFVDGFPQETPLEGSECYRCTFDTSIHENDLDVQSYPVAHSLNPDETHEIRIVKDSEADWNRCEPWPNWLVFHGIKVDAGRAAPAPPPPDQLRIEIVGGSTTSGYCNLCVAPWHAPTGDSVDQRSASLDLAWTGILCNNMTAACHITAWSGLGVISNLGTKQGRWHTPDLFRRGVQSDPASVWDFSSWVPNVLLIDLGSNDRSAWDDPNFVSTFLQFVSNYTSAYGPKTKVLVGCGMTETGYCPHIHSVVKQSQDNGLSVHYMDLSGMQDWACCGHPSPTAHAKIAAHVRNLVEHVLAGGGGDGEPNGPGPDGPPLDPDGGNNSPIPPHTTTPKPTLAPHPNGVGAHHHWKLIAVAASVAALAVVFVSVMCCVRRQKEKSENLLDADHP